MLMAATEIVGDTLIAKMRKDLGEFQGRDIDKDGDEIVQKLEDPALRNVVLDLNGTDYFGSSALNMFLRVERKTQSKNGKLVFVGLSPHEKEILHVTKLDSKWLVCDTREEAMAALERTAISPS
jgi:anti-anti-sigma factor